MPPSASNLELYDNDGSPTTHFLCTFCWQPSGDERHPARAVGHSARLVYESCYAALIDLAICWVCGDLVFRGDECVSLGWCFWHRGCYGCLLCGSRLIVQGPTVAELFEEKTDGYGRRDRGGYTHWSGAMRGRHAPSDDAAQASGQDHHGREIDEIPLCRRCQEEIEKESLDEAQIVPMALERIDQYDGGWTRARWEARQHESAEEDNDIMPSPAACSKRRAARQYERDGTASLHDAPGGSQGPYNKSSSPKSTVYVSMHDPIGRPSFRPSKTKPIPTWMQMLPSQREAKDCLPHPPSVLDSYFATHLPASHSDPLMVTAGTAAATTETSIIPERRVVPEEKAQAAAGPPTRSKSNQAPGTWPSSPTLPPIKSDRSEAAPIRMSRSFTFISDEPVQRPSARAAHQQAKIVRFNQPGSKADMVADRPESPVQSTEFLERYQRQKREEVFLPSSIAERLAMADAITGRSTLGSRPSKARRRPGSTQSHNETISLRDAPVLETLKGRATLQDQLKRLFGFS